VLQNRFARIAVAGALTVVPIGAALGVAASPAWAVTKTISCGKLTGTATTTVTLSACKVIPSTVVNNTGGASIAEPVSTLSAGGPVTWVKAHTPAYTTTVGKPTLTTITGTAFTCATGDSEIHATGAVTKDTTKDVSPLPGHFSIWVCSDASGNLTLAPTAVGATTLKHATFN
jgi:hypothetical protein